MYNTVCLPAGQCSRLSVLRKKVEIGHKNRTKPDQHKACFILARNGYCVKFFSAIVAQYNFQGGEDEMLWRKHVTHSYLVQTELLLELEISGHKWKRKPLDTSQSSLYLNIVLRCRVLFETLMAKKCPPPLLQSHKVNFRVHKSQPLDCNMSQKNPVHTIKPYTLYFTSTLILSSHVAQCSQAVSSLQILQLNFEWVWHSLHARYMASYIYLLCVYLSNRNRNT
jgi:hypothetical protein